MKTKKTQSKQRSNFYNPFALPFTVKKPQSKQKTLLQKLKSQPYEAKPKQYCCLYHQKDGKHTKGISPCLHHVANGIINPITALNSKQMKLLENWKQNKTKTQFINSQVNKNLQVQADQLILNYHTHFTNQINKRASLPKKLVKPNVYVQKILNKNKGKTQYVFSKQKQKASYKQIQTFFKLFAEKTQFKTVEAFQNDMIKFYNDNNIASLSKNNVKFGNIHLKQMQQQYLFTKINFMDYLKSHNFSNQQAMIFWQSIYDEDAFKIIQKSQKNILTINNEFISMKSFGYNFKKYYLQTQEQYTNMFSQTAFRQRLIDLRLILQNWSNKYIIFMEKAKKFKENQLGLLVYLKQQGLENQYHIILNLKDQRQNIILFMRNIAKIIYNQTDQKNFGHDVWNQRLSYLIQQKTQSSICFLQFTKKFKQFLLTSSNEQDTKKSFKLTQMVQYLNEHKNEYEQVQQRWIIQNIRKIYLYLYFTQNRKELSLDYNSLRLKCKQSISLTEQTLQQFISYKTSLNDEYIQLLSNIAEQIQQKIQLIPELTGQNKQYLLECNYIAETFLRLIKRKKFTSFYTLYQINYLIQSTNQQYSLCIQEMKQLIRKSKDQQNYIHKQENYNINFFKMLFSLEQSGRYFDKLKLKYIYINGNNINKSQNQQISSIHNIKDAMNKYKNVKQTLGVTKVVKDIQKSLQNIKIKPKTDKNLQSLYLKDKQINTNLNNKQINTKDSKNIQKSKDPLNQIVLNKQRVQTMQKQKDSHRQKNMKNLQQIHLSTYSEYDYYNLPSYSDKILSTNISSTISKVQGMQSYLEDLLKDIKF